MNVDEVIKFIETSDEETDSLLASALKQKKKKPRKNKEKVLMI